MVLANDFDAHAALALAFLDRGVHVLSETAACTNEDEGRRLIKAAERSTATYSFAENYVAHPHVRAIREAVDTGEVGRVELIEADYLHGMSPDRVAALVLDRSHWRGRIAPTAYCTHTMSPVLAITRAWPVQVTSFTVDAEQERTPAPLFLGGQAVERAAEGTALLLETFRATIEHGKPPLVPVRPAVVASLVGVMGAVSLGNGSCPVPVPDVSQDPEAEGEATHPQ